MISINPYLNLAGNTEEAFNFYKSVFGGEFISLQRFKETSEAAKLPSEDPDKMHVSLSLGNQTILMGTDAIESMGHSLSVGNNFSLSVNTDSEQEAEKIFNGLSAGGEITMPLQKTFWGAYFGMLKDKFGIQWMVSYEYKG